MTPLQNLKSGLESAKTSEKHGFNSMVWITQSDAKEIVKMLEGKEIEALVCDLFTGNFDSLNGCQFIADAINEKIEREKP